MSLQVFCFFDLVFFFIPLRSTCLACISLDTTERFYFFIFLFWLPPPCLMLGRALDHEPFLSFFIFFSSHPFFQVHSGFICTKIIFYEICASSFGYFLSKSNLAFLFLRITSGLHLVIKPSFTKECLECRLWQCTVESVNLVRFEVGVCFFLELILYALVFCGLSGLLVLLSWPLLIRFCCLYDSFTLVLLLDIILKVPVRSYEMQFQHLGSTPDLLISFAASLQE